MSDVRDVSPINPRLPMLWHGGDYNPDQWPDKTLDDDIRLMNLSGCNVMSVGIFSWAHLEPAPGEFDFAWLDRVMDRLHDGGVYVALATPSAAHPRWLSDMHPEVLGVDESGRRLSHGSRVRYCPSSPVYRRHVQRINRALAKRYGDHPALVLWHVSNEYSSLSGKGCRCNLCTQAFQDWLARRYGDIDTLNQQYWSGFWSQRFFDFSQINPPSSLNRAGCLNGLELDWKRFYSTLMTDFFKAETAVLRELSPDIPITHNMMGFYPGLDYRSFADVMDVISWDSYPEPDQDPAEIAFAHAYMRGLKDNKPWLLMEQTPSSTNWKEYHRLKPPGMFENITWQAIGCGSDSSMYFQWRRCRGGHEKYHGAVVAHVGTENTRVFGEVSHLGEQMKSASEALVGTQATPARIGLLWDQENRWALEGSTGPGKHKRVMEAACKHFAAVYHRKVPIDAVRMDADWSQYDILIAPTRYMIRSGQFPLEGTREELSAKIDEAAKIRTWVENGGTFVTTYLTGMVNENDLVYEGGYPGPLRDVLGIWNEEIDNHPQGEAPNRVVPADGAPLSESGYPCDHFFELIHAESAEVVATYGENWYAGRPAITRNVVGKGEAWYIATDPEEPMLRELYSRLAEAKGIEPLADGPDDVEVLLREGNGRRVLVVNNRSAETRTVRLHIAEGRDVLTDEFCSGEVPLEPRQVRVVLCS